MTRFLPFRFMWADTTIGGSARVTVEAQDSIFRREATVANQPVESCARHFPALLALNMVNGQKPNLCLTATGTDRAISVNN